MDNIQGLLGSLAKERLEEVSEALEAVKKGDVAKLFELYHKLPPGMKETLQKLIVQIAGNKTGEVIIPLLTGL